MAKSKSSFINIMDYLSKFAFRSYVLVILLPNLAQGSAIAMRHGPTVELSDNDLMEVENGNFRCPETLSSLNDKIIEANSFLNWTKINTPNGHWKKL